MPTLGGSYYCSTTTIQPCSSLQCAVQHSSSINLASRLAIYSLEIASSSSTAQSLLYPFMLVMLMPVPTQILLGYCTMASKISETLCNLLLLVPLLHYSLGSKNGILVQKSGKSMCKYECSCMIQSNKHIDLTKFQKYLSRQIRFCYK